MITANRSSGSVALGAPLQIRLARLAPWLNPTTPSNGPLLWSYLLRGELTHTSNTRF
jgi:hypothetical protein